jgi:hypothetical protein
MHVIGTDAEDVTILWLTKWAQGGIQQIQEKKNERDAHTEGLFLLLL